MADSIRGALDSDFDGYNSSEYLKDDSSDHDSDNFEKETHSVCFHCLCDNLFMNR
jgi:hypothetical protein